VRRFYFFPVLAAVFVVVHVIATPVSLEFYFKEGGWCGSERNAMVLPDSLWENDGDNYRVFWGGQWHDIEPTKVFRGTGSRAVVYLHFTRVLKAIVVTCFIAPRKG
jgi:hypothetical protein